MAGVLFVVGSTSVGKSRFALDLAEQFGGEIVNADAFQVYDGLELLTSRPGREDCNRVPHHLFGVIPLTATFNVARYLAEAQRCLQEIRQRGRLAIVVGGTGLYVKALTHGLSPLPPSDPAVRAELEAMSQTVLEQKLAALDPASMSQIDLKNRRRVVRALEVCLATGQPFSSFRDAWSRTDYQPGEAGVFLERPIDELRSRIDEQVDRMFEAGVVEEVRRLLPANIGETAATTIGLPEIRELISGRMSLTECRDRIKIRTRQYAKRQITWFKKETIFRRVAMPCEMAARFDGLRHVFPQLATPRTSL